MHKVREYRSLLKNIPNLDVYSLRDFQTYHLPEETGETFEENATLKAVDAAKELGKWVIADDSGLVVPALDGKPGVRSARYAGDDATDLDNRKKLVSELQKLPEEKRIGYFECCIAFATPDGLKKLVRGKCEGELLTQERGRHGFGYDPLFLKYDYSKTFAELDEETKNRISHRRKAFDKIVTALELAVAESTCTT